MGPVPFQHKHVQYKLGGEVMNTMQGRDELGCHPNSIPKHLGPVMHESLNHKVWSLVDNIVSHILELGMV